jgi:hypothetical protein
MRSLHFVAALMIGAVLFAASGCGESSGGNPSPVAAEDAAKASAALDQQNQQSDPLLKASKKK